MILPLFRRAGEAAKSVVKPADTISALYGMIVAQARRPIFYRELGVADTVDGRFELIVLHLALVLRRLDGEDETARDLGQRIFDRFCKDMDDNLREIGISDLKVPKEMRRIGAAFYGRARAYTGALAADDENVLTETASRNVFGGRPRADNCISRLVAYIRHAAADLAAQDVAAITAGELRFPEP